MHLNSETQLYGILGNPVRHSLSPELHNALFQRHGLNAVYLAFEPDPGQLSLAFEAIRALGLRGVNITIPFKEEAENLCDEVPEDIDRLTGAVNTVVNRGGRLFGYNTDGPGFLGSLREDLGFDPAGKRVLVLGAGGAARGVVFALAGAATEEILVLNRSVERAIGLAGYAAERFADTEIRALTSLDEALSERVDLIVNATSLGLRLNDPLPFPLKLIKYRPAVIDLIYRPSRTPWLAEAQKLGLTHANGLGMLAGQAALSFGLWTGIQEGVRETMLEVLKQWK